MGKDSRFDEFPEEFILMYVSSAELKSPMRLFESCSIESVTLKLQEFARTDEVGVDAENDVCLGLRVSDLKEMSVKTVTGREIKFGVKEERVALLSDVAGNEDEALYSRRYTIIDIGQYHDDGELRFLVRKQVKIESLIANNVVELSVVAPDVSHRVKLEAVVYNRDFKLAQVMEDMIKSTLDGLKNGNLPERIIEGATGVYYMHDSSGEKLVSVFKPTDEERQATNNPFETEEVRFGSDIRTGDGAIREVAAYLLDHPRNGHRSVCSDVIGSAGVPPTVMVRCLHYGFNSHGLMVWKTGSLQKFIDNACTTVINEDEDEDDDAFLSLDEIQRISVLDIRLANSDRHLDNILLRWDADEERSHLIPIDHAACFPDSATGECRFEWIWWPKASEKYSSEIEEYVKNLDADKDIEYLKSYGWDMGPKSARTFRICTMLLKLGVEKKLTAWDIGTTMLRPEEYALREMVQEAEQISGADASEAEFLRNLSSVMNTQLLEMAMRSEYSD